MYSVQKISPHMMTSEDYHMAAARHHQEAAASNLTAAAHFAYGNYQEANEQARLAKYCGEQAIENCEKAMK